MSHWRKHRLHPHCSVTSFRNLILLTGLTGFLAACSQYSTRPIPVAYHNLTARYNAYLIARDDLRAVEKALYKARQENYNQPLPILLPLDSLTLNPVRAQLDDAIKKASLVAERHQNSKWLDNSYVLLGKARLLKEDYANAMEVFKYVNSKGRGSDEKHEALVALMRAYIEQRDFANALSVADYVRAQPLNKANTRDYYLTKAYLHQRTGEYATAAAILDATFPYLEKDEQTARLHLIAGQLYDLIGKPQQALAHFRQVDKNRPSYEQSFYASLYTMQSGSDARIIVDRFNRMLDDRKNVDLRDKIYYTMGLLDVRNERYDQAIDNWRRSIQATTSNTARIPYTYMDLAKLHLEKLQDYPKAKAYFDSSLALLPRQSPDYADLVSRKKTLDELVQHQQTIQREDSLQRLAQMNPAALDRLLDAAIDRQIKIEQQQEEARLKAQSASAAASPPTDIDPAQRWSLYNPVYITQGQMEFRQRWGNRPLTDNWRRSVRETQDVAADGQSTDSTSRVAMSGSSGISISETERKTRKQALYATIPMDGGAAQQSNRRLETAYYQLGKLYKFSFNQPEKAISTFETLLNRFPMAGARPEVYYLLVLANEQLNRPSDWKSKLLAEFPASSYARMVSRSGSGQTGGESVAQQTYKEIYTLYAADRLTEALARTENAMSLVTGSQVEDKLAFLRVLLIGKVQGVEPYRQALNEFVRDYPSSPLLSRVKEMIAAADQPTAKRK